MKHPHLLLLVLASALLTGAADSAMAAEQDSFMPLEGSNWQLEKLTVLGGFEFTPDDPDSYVLNFRSDNRLTGRSDCNQLSGLWHQEGEALHFDPFLSGRNLCPPGSLHNNLVLYLKDVNTATLRDGRLIMLTDTEGVAMEFSAR